MMADIIILTLIVLPLTVWIYYRFFRLSRFGLSGPQHIPFLEDLLDFRRNNYQLHSLVDKYVKRFGNKFAFCHQGQPLVVTTDADLMHKILIKHRSNFLNRKFFIDLPWPCNEMVTMAKGGKVKLLRSFLKELLKVDSLKEMTSVFRDTADNTVNFLKTSVAEEKEIDALSLAEGYIMEILLKAAFSLDHPNQSEFNKALVNLSRTFLQPPRWVHIVAGLPLGHRVVKYIPGAFKNNLKPFIDTAIGIVAERGKEKDRKPKDILDALLAAQLEHPELQDEDLLAQGIVLLLAVHSNTSVAIAATSYAIAKHQAVQDKLQAEIDEALMAGKMSGDFPTWDDIQTKLPYLDQVVNESLRLYTPDFMVTRECTKDIEIDNICFKEGDGVLFPIYSIHRDPNIYDEPLCFNPDRFSGKRLSTSSYMPFGEGNRGCVGYKMALAEIKIYLTKLLSNHRIQLVDENEELCLESESTVQLTMLVTKPVMIKVLSRPPKPA